MGDIHDPYGRFSFVAADGPVMVADVQVVSVVSVSDDDDEDAANCTEEEEDKVLLAVVDDDDDGAIFVAVADAIVVGNNTVVLPGKRLKDCVGGIVVIKSNMEAMKDAKRQHRSVC